MRGAEDNRRFRDSFQILRDRIGIAATGILGEIVVLEPLADRRVHLGAEVENAVIIDGFP
jgi:hypothetical protein